MIRMDLLAAAEATAATLVGENTAFAGVSTDSRKVGKGELFFALRGENFDGHQFVAAARDSGAAAAVVCADAAGSLADIGLPLLLVSDTRLALGALAAEWRARFDLPLIAVTGSNGKTTTKEMIAAILRAAFSDAVLATQGNFNNDIGLPLTLLQLNAEHRAAIIEMGMNCPGEIEYLTAIAAPTVALVTNAQRAHLAGMGSLEAIALEKGSIYAGLGSDGIAVINADDEWAGLWRQQNEGRRTLEFGFVAGAGVSGRCRIHGLDNELTLSFGGERLALSLPLPGLHNARNALAAAAATLAAGLPMSSVKTGLSGFQGAKGRLQRRAGLNGAVVLDDTYNANPDSVRAGIDVLAATVGRKLLVLGDMGEIGEMAGQFHDEIGGYAKSQGVDRLYTLGEASELASHNFGSGGRHFRKIEALQEAVRAEMSPDTTVLVKGSRFMRMERISDAISVTAPAETNANATVESH